jgi:hypothetical protein
MKFGQNSTTEKSVNCVNTNGLMRSVMIHNQPIEIVSGVLK